MIQTFFNKSNPISSDVGKVIGFGNVLANKAIGILIGASLPGVVRSGEVEGDVVGGFDVAVSVELAAVVRSDRAHEAWVAVDELAQTLVGRGHGPVGEFADEQEAFDYWRARRLFADWPEDSLWAYTRSMLKPHSTARSTSAR